MPRLHMQVWQPDTEEKTCIKVCLCCQLAQYLVCEEKKAFLKTAAMKFVFQKLETPFYKVKPFSVNAA